jgi:hypothetical protein
MEANGEANGTLTGVETGGLQSGENPWKSEAAKLTDRSQFKRLHSEEKLEEFRQSALKTERRRKHFEMHPGPDARILALALTRARVNVPGKAEECSNPKRTCDEKSGQHLSPRNKLFQGSLIDRPFI